MTGRTRRLLHFFFQNDEPFYKAVRYLRLGSEAREACRTLWGIWRREKP